MRTITTQELKIAAAKAYLAGKLTAQAKRWQDRVCNYRGAGDSCCAIGAGLTPDEHNSIQALGLNGRPITALFVKGVCEFEDYDFAGQLQNAHDRWACATFANSDGKESHKTRSAREVFEMIVGNDILANVVVGYL